LLKFVVGKAVTLKEQEQELVMLRPRKRRHVFMF